MRRCKYSCGVSNGVLLYSMKWYMAWKITMECYITWSTTIKWEVRYGVKCCMASSITIERELVYGASIAKECKVNYGV